MKELESNSEHFAALWNRGKCKIDLSKGNKDMELLKEGIDDVENGLKIMAKKDNHNFPAGERWLKVAKVLLKEWER